MSGGAPDSPPRLEPGGRPKRQVDTREFVILFIDTRDSANIVRAVGRCWCGPARAQRARAASDRLGVARVSERPSGEAGWQGGLAGAFSPSASASAAGRAGSARASG
eukprot:15465568-Alexandrium_andersonii.AAC.1